MLCNVATPVDYKVAAKGTAKLSNKLQPLHTALICRHTLVCVPPPFLIPTISTICYAVLKGQNGNDYCARQCRLRKWFGHSRTMNEYILFCMNYEIAIFHLCAKSLQATVCRSESFVGLCGGGSYGTCALQ